MHQTTSSIPTLMRSLLLLVFSFPRVFSNSKFQPLREPTTSVPRCDVAPVVGCPGQGAASSKRARVGSSKSRPEMHTAAVDAYMCREVAQDQVAYHMFTIRWEGKQRKKNNMCLPPTNQQQHRMNESEKVKRCIVLMLEIRGIDPFVAPLVCHAAISIIVLQALGQPASIWSRPFGLHISSLGQT